MKRARWLSALDSDYSSCAAISIFAEGFAMGCQVLLYDVVEGHTVNGRNSASGKSERAE